MNLVNTQVLSYNSQYYGGVCCRNVVGVESLIAKDLLPLALQAKVFCYQHAGVTDILTDRTSFVMTVDFRFQFHSVIFAGGCLHLNFVLLSM